MTSEKKKSNFILQGGILGIAGIITRLIGMLYRIPVTNIIGPTGNGYYAAAYQVYTVMLLISSYSLPLAVSKLISARISKGELRNASKIFNGALIFAVCTGLTVCLLLFFGASFFAKYIMSEPMSEISLKIFAPTLLIVAIMGVIRGYFQGMGTMVPTAVSQIIEQIINAIVSILAAKALFNYGKGVAALLRNNSFSYAYGAAGSTLGTSLGAMAGLIFLLIMLSGASKRLLSGQTTDSTRFSEDYKLVFHVLIATIIPVILSTAIYNIGELLSNSMFNKIMLTKGLGDKKSYIWGVYSGEYKLLLNVPIALSSAMSASVVPTLSACIAAKDKKSACRKVSQVVRFTMIIAFPCAFGLMVLSDPIMNLLFKDGANMAASLMRLGFVNIILYSLSTLTNGILQGLNRMKLPVRHSVISLILQMTVLYFLLSFTDLGIYGVIVANFCFALFMCYLNQMAIRNTLKFRLNGIRCYIVPLIASLAMAAVIFILNKIFSTLMPDLISIMLCIAAGSFSYFFVLVRIGGVSPKEIASMPMGKLLGRILKMVHII